MKSEREAALVDVFVQRSLGAMETYDRERPDSPRLEPCLDLHGIVRERSYLARDGSRILCHFRAPDAESLRMALRGAGVNYDALWTGVVRDIPGAADFVLVLERAFDFPVSQEHERRCRTRTTRRLLELGVEPARVLLSRCRKHLRWLCRAATPDAARAAEIELAGHGLKGWCCEPVSPAVQLKSTVRGSLDHSAERG